MKSAEKRNKNTEISVNAENFHACSNTILVSHETLRIIYNIFTGCTPLINRVRRHLASQYFEIGNLATLPCLSKCQKHVENGVDALVFYIICALLLAFSTSWYRKSNIFLRNVKFEARSVLY